MNKQVQALVQAAEDLLRECNTASPARQIQLQRQLEQALRGVEPPVSVNPYGWSNQQCEEFLEDACGWDPALGPTC